MTHLINLKGVTVSYPKDGGGRRTIIDNVSLRVREGEFLTVVGPSGCGKSTLLRMVMGSQFPNQGESFVDGKPVVRVSRDCGIVYQNYCLFPHLSVLDNIAFGVVIEKTSIPGRMVHLPLVGLEKGLDLLALRLTARGGRYDSTALRQRLEADFRLEMAKPDATKTPIWLALENAPKPIWSQALLHLPYFRVKKAARLEAMQLLDDVGLDPIKDGPKYPYELSGGMRQRVAVAQALIMKPKILLMDEPFGALDKKTRDEMQDFIHDQWARHKLTVFFVTHDLPEAVKLGTRLICLSQYWSKDNGDKAEGARLVVDRKVLGGAIKPSTFKNADEYKALVEGIGRAGLDPNYLQPESQFDLSHEDAVAGGGNDNKRGASS